MTTLHHTPNEIEIKLRVPGDYEQMSRRIGQAGAQYVRDVTETNIFLDTSDGQLRAGRSVLRLRHRITPEGQVLPSIITWKGRKTGTEISSRPSIDVSAQPPAMVELLLMNLGYVKTMEFQKRRRSFEFRDCLVELDDMPVFGYFLEIEAPTEATVAAARHDLALDDLAVEETSYFSMVRTYLQKHPELAGKLHFPMMP